MIMSCLTTKFQSFSQTVFLVLTFFLLSFSGAQAQGNPQGSSVKLENPLVVNSIEELLLGILDIVIIIAVPIIIFFIIYAGFLYATARGNADKTSQATRALTYAVIGGVLVIGAIAITQIIENLVIEFQQN